ncbi:hypothetical protein QZH41_002657 [Actinostola sp. cb2023]|nr:hypothetical protein QZH41_002657 [Actinostola sp. cb2023]
MEEFISRKYVSYLIGYLGTVGFAANLHYLPLAIAIYTTIWTILGGVERVDAGFKWFIFLTNWSYTFLNVHFIISALLPAYYHYVYTQRKVLACDSNDNEDPDKQEIGQLNLESARPDDDKPDSNLRHPRMLILSFKASWVIFNIAANLAPLVTVMYWAFDYVPGQFVDASSANAHALNTLLMIIDIMICNVPFRLLHFIYPMFYALVYTSFTVIYWAVGGTNHRGEKYIYAIMDYEKNAGLAFIMAAMFVFLAIPVSQFLLYGLYRFRVWLVTRRHRPLNKAQKL